MKSKRGFLLGEHTLKIIIAVLCLLLLIYLLYSLYSNSKDERNLQLAEATLDELAGKMEEAKEGSPQTMVLLNPEKWFLIGYSEKDNKPLECSGDCICICTSGGWVSKNDIQLCEMLGVCKNFSDKINKKFAYQIREGSVRSLWGLLVDEAEELNIKYNDKEGFEITKK